MFGVTSVAGLKVRVEPKKRPTSQTQCYRCQAFGHIDHEICAFCADNHECRSCPKSRGRGEPAVCANCGGNHPAFFRTWPKNQINIKMTQEDRKRAVVEASQVRPNKSYAQVARPSGSENSGHSGKVPTIYDSCP